MAQVISTAGFRAPNRTAEALDTILKGLQIAEAGYGLVTKAEDRSVLERQREIQREREERELKIREGQEGRAVQQAERETQGIMTPRQIAELQKGGLRVGPSDGGPLQSGQFKIKSTTGEELVVSPAIRPPDFERVETVDEQGRPVVRFVRKGADLAGQTFIKPPPQQKQAPSRLAVRTERTPEGGTQTVVRDLAAGDVLPEEAPTGKEIRRDVRNLVQDTEQHRGALLNIESVEKKLGFDLEDFDAQTGLVAGKEVDLPGVSLPLVGRVATTSEARSLKDRIARVFNTELKTRSGAAVTDQELNRLREEFGQGKFNTEAQLIEALKEYKRLAIEAMASHEAGFDPLVLREYSERENALTSRSFARGRNDALVDAQGQPRPPSREEILLELQRRGRVVQNGN